MTALTMDVRELTVGEIDGVSGGGRWKVLFKIINIILTADPVSDTPQPEKPEAPPEPKE